MPLDRFSAAWREQYVTDASGAAAEAGGCVFCALAQLEPTESTGVLWRGEHTYVVLNAFPYGSGHLLVVPIRHVATLQELAEPEHLEFFGVVRRVAAALEEAYHPDGMNVGFNLGQAGGAGIPQHLHGHVLPRWLGDTNFMTTIAETRVLPESLASTWRKVHVALGS